MPYSRSNPVKAALRSRDADPCTPRLQVANGTRSMVLPDGIAALRLSTDAAWEPMLTGQAVPMIGERVYAEPCDDG